MDLNALRKNNISEKYNKFLEANLGKIEQHDQTTINVVCQGKTSTLPPKYGMWNFVKREDLIKHNCYGNINSNIKAYDEKEFFKAWKLPAIIHYVRAKPWKRKGSFTHREFHEKWWEYAQKSDEFDNILKFYGGKK